MPKQLGNIAGKALGFFGAKALSPSLPSFRPSPTITTPAFNLTGSPGGAVNLQRLAGPQRFAGILGELEAVKAEVKPGFGRFTEAAVTAIRNAKSKALGTARDVLARRRVAGASFAINQLTNIERQFAQDEELARSGALLQEIETTTQLIDASFKAQSENFRLDLDELRVAAGVSANIMQVMSQQAVIDKELAAQAIAGTGAFLSGIAEDIGGFFGNLIKDKGGNEGRLAVEAAKLFAGSGGGGSGGFGTSPSATI